MPLTVIQLLWLNLLTDGAPALALAMEKGDPDIMEHPPRPKSESIVNSSMRLGMVIQTITQTGAVLGAFVLGLYWHLEAGASIPDGMSALSYVLQHNWSGVDVQTAETMAFVTLSLCELFRAYTVRSERTSIFKLGIFSNKYMQYAVGLSIFLLLLVVNVPSCSRSSIPISCLARNGWLCSVWRSSRPSQKKSPSSTCAQRMPGRRQYNKLSHVISSFEPV